MSEFISRSPYSAAARKVTEAFTSSPEELAKYEQRGLIATNNLGLRMQVFEAGPESELWKFHCRSLFTEGVTDRLERARTIDPELWHESIAAYQSRKEQTDAYVSAWRQFGPDDPRTQGLLQQGADAEWRDVELRSRIFSIIEQEPLSEDEALALCR